MFNNNNIKKACSRILGARIENAQKEYNEREKELIALNDVEVAELKDNLSRSKETLTSELVKGVFNL